MKLESRGKVTGNKIKKTIKKKPEKESKNVDERRKR